MTATIRERLVHFSELTNKGSTIFVDKKDGIHLPEVNRINLDEWLEKQKTSGNYTEGQQLVEVVRRYQNLEQES